MSDIEYCPREVMLVEDARRMLAEANSLDKVFRVLDGLEALRMYLRKRKAGIRVLNEAIEVKLEAERRAGEMLRVRPKHPPGPDRSHDGTDLPDRSHDGTDLPPKLSELGISKNESSRLQAVASVPEEVFREHIEKTKGEDKELTTASVLRLAARQHIIPPADACDSHCGGDIVGSLSALVEAGRKFRTIYADPPWRYGNQATRASTDNHYDTMTVDEICAEPVSQVVEPDAHLHLWTTNAFLRDAFRVMEAWGFTYKSCYVWVKTQMGIGNYWRVSHEFLLFGLRGTLPFQARDEMSWGEFERSQHSTKPDAIRMKVERVSPGPHLEMYGRISIPNSSWTVYGNQVSRRLF